MLKGSPDDEDSLTEDAPVSKNRYIQAWDLISQAGLAEIVLRLGTHVLLVAVILISAWGLRALFEYSQVTGTLRINHQGISKESASSYQFSSGGALLPPASQTILGITRRARIHTDVPTRARQEVFQYTVREGDSLFGIADKFKLKPETILWANQTVLGDNPHNLRPGQELNILPVDGVYHRWSAGDGLNSVASFFGVNPEDIISFPTNQLSMETIGNISQPNIEAGSWLVIPAGRREFVSWSAPVIPLDNPGVAKVLGPGACDQVSTGVVGTGTFIWPTNNHSLSGFDYEPTANHPGIDLGGAEGEPVNAVDSGIVVYAGWNNWGYGNVVVINHGNDWQSLYAHLSTIYVSCGQIVFQGNPVGAIGSTGNADGPHLHLEMMYSGVRVNPKDYVR